MNQMKRNQAGFTLVELVVVIVILGILTATALPRFVDLTSDARESSANGIVGGLRSAVTVAQARYFANGSTTATTIDMVGAAGVTVNAGTGIPDGTLTGIGRAMTSTEGYTVSYTDPAAVTFRPANGGSATCQATYNGTTGAVALIVTGC